jgi:6,7-dimethyl-8-ribityllumazine synthase
MMAGHSDNDMGLPSFDKPVKVALVIAPYYTSIAEAQLSAARGVLDKAGVAHETIEVPGSLEIPTAIGIAQRLSNFDGYVALGCVIRGATSHYDVVVNESARALTMLGLQGVCIGNGIITVENRDRRRNARMRRGSIPRAARRRRRSPHRVDAALREA